MPVDDVGHEEGVGLVHAVDGLHGEVGAEVTAAEGKVPEIDIISNRLNKDPRGHHSIIIVTAAEGKVPEINMISYRLKKGFRGTIQ